MNDRFADARHDVWHHAKKMWEQGLVVASAGNVSRRIDTSLIAITPTSIPYDTMRADEIVVVSLENGEPVDSTRGPSYELPMHLALYRGRDDIGGVVLTHAPYVTTLSVLRRKLPPVIDEMML